MTNWRVVQSAWRNLAWKLEGRKEKVTGNKGGGVTKREWVARDLRRRLAIRRELNLAKETIRLQNEYSARLNLVLDREKAAREIDLSHINTLEELVHKKNELLENKSEQVEVYRDQVANLHNVLEERAQSFHEENNCDCKEAKVYKKQVKSLEKLACSSRSLIRYLHKQLENTKEEKERRDRPASLPTSERSSSPAEDGEISGV